MTWRGPTTSLKARSRLMAVTRYSRVPRGPAAGKSEQMATDRERVFTLEATPVKFGPGSSQDAGWELARLGVRRAMLVTDPGVAALGPPERIKALVEAEGIAVVVYDASRVEPTLDSLQDAADF